MPVPRRPLALVAVWIAGALVATATGVLAVRQVATSVGDDAPPPLSASGVETALGSATPGAPAPSGGGPTAAPAAPTTSPAALAASAVSRSFSSQGGSVGVSCTGGSPRLVFATPAQGWAVDDQEVEREHVEVRFEGPGEVRMRVRCGADGPTVTVDDRTSGSEGSGGDDD